MDLLRFARLVRRRWLLIVGCTVVGAVLGVGSTAFRHEAAPAGVYYRSTETLTTRHDGSDNGGGFQGLSQVALRVTSGNVPKLVAAKIGGDADRLVERITVLSNDTLGTLAITAIAPTALEANRLATTFGSELVAALEAEGVQAYQDSTKNLLAKRDALKAHEVDLDAQITAAPPSVVEDLRAERDATADELRLTLTQIAQHSFDSPQGSPVEELDAPQALPISRAEYRALLDRGIQGDHLTQVSENGEVQGATAASVGPDLSGPGPRGVIGALLGMFLGIGIALLLDMFDRRIRSREEVELAYGAPVLAEIPASDLSSDGSPVIISAAAPYSCAAEGYRAVRSAVLFERALAEQHDAASPPSTGIVVMVVSGVAAEGKSTTTANLAVAFAEAGSSVLAVNGDFRRPTLHRQFGLDDRPGEIVETGIAGVHAVTNMAVSPSATPAQVVEAQRQMVQTTRRHYDVVLLDTAPMLSTNDAIDVAPLADLVLVVAHYGITKSHHARRTAELLERLRAPVAGVGFVATPASGSDGGYSYYYNYGSDPAAVAPSAPGTSDAPVPAMPAIPAIVVPTVRVAEVASPAAPGDHPLVVNGNGNGHAANGNGHAANGNGHAANGNGHAANGHAADDDTEEPPTPALSWQAPLQWKANS